MKVREGDKLVPCEREATIEDLLSMKAGLNYANMVPGGRPDIERMMQTNPNASTQEFIHQWLQAPLDFQPGSRYLYSMCIDVLGAVIEVATGQGYADYIAEHIAKPLGMKDYSFHVRPEDAERMVQQYQYDGNSQISIHNPEFVPMDKLYNIGVFGPNYDSAGAGMISRVSDYVLLADALANDGVGANGTRILTRQSIDEIRKNRMTNKTLYSDLAKLQNYGYGYGLAVRTLVNSEAAKSPVGEFGWDGMNK